LTVAAALLCVVGLSACDNNLFRSPIAVQRVGTDLLIAFCDEPVEVERIFASSQNRDKGIALRFWDATGLATLASGQIVAVSEGVEGLDQRISREPYLDAGTTLTVVAVGTDSRTGYSADISLGDKELPEDEWLRTDGSVSELPCAEVGTASAAN
jgi:hypothetical protein